MTKRYRNKKHPDTVIEAYQVPAPGEQPTQAEIDWLNNLPCEFSGDDGGIALHRGGIDVLVAPGDYVVEGAGVAIGVPATTFLAQWEPVVPSTPKERLDKLVEQSTPRRVEAKTVDELEQAAKQLSHAQQLDLIGRLVAVLQGNERKY